MVFLVNCGKFTTTWPRSSVLLLMFIAKNFIKQSKSIQSNIITISRSSNNKNDLVCNIGEFISTKDIDSIVAQIKKFMVAPGTWP